MLTKLKNIILAIYYVFRITRANKKVQKSRNGLDRNLNYQRYVYYSKLLENIKGGDEEEVEIKPQRFRKRRKLVKTHEQMTIAIVLICSVAIGYLAYTNHQPVAPVVYTKAPVHTVKHVTVAKPKVVHEIPKHVVVLKAPKPVVKSSVTHVVHDDTYVVKSGDSLWKIAKKVYGNGSDWTKLYQTNKSVLHGSHGGQLIYAGQTLHVLKGGNA